MCKILLTKEERKALVVLHSDASHGPWAYESDGDNGNFNVGIVLDDDDKPISGYVEDNTFTVVDVVARDVEGSPNAAFIVEAYNAFPRLLYSLEILEARAEQAEAALESALQVNAARQAEGIANILNGMMAGITGEKGSVRLELGGYHCPYCNEVSKTIEAATEHDATCPKHPAVIRAEKNEAENARLTKVVNWMADKLGTRHPDCPLKYLKQRPLGWKCHEGSQGPCTKAQAVVCWAEAARHAVSKQPVSNAATAFCPICGQSGHIGDCEED